MSLSLRLNQPGTSVFHLEPESKSLDETLDTRESASSTDISRQRGALFAMAVLGVPFLVGLARAVRQGGRTAERDSRHAMAANALTTTNSPCTLVVEVKESERATTDRRRSRVVDRRFQWANTVMNVATLGLLALAGVVGYWNWIALEQSNEVARTSFTTSQRAYVNVAGLDIQPVQDPKGTVSFWRATPIISNTGNTATKNAWWTSVHGDTRGILYGPVEVDGHRYPGYTTSGPDGPKLQTYDELNSATRNRLVLGPRQEVRPLGYSTPLPRDWVAGLIKGTARIYIHGVLFYQDFFTQRGHVTRYCFSLWHNAAVTGPNIAYSGCPGVANCTDEECEDYERLVTLADPATASQ